MNKYRNVGSRVSLHYAHCVLTQTNTLHMSKENNSEHVARAKFK